MTGKKICLLIMVLFCLISHTALAADWVFLQQSGNRYGDGKEYIDADSVILEEDTLVYWLLWVRDLDSPPGHPKSILWKKEVQLRTPMQRRYLETYQFDVAGQPAVINNFFYQQPLDYFPVSLAEEVTIRQILAYARKGKLSESARPADLMVPVPQWYGTVEDAECLLYWDIRSIASRPRENQTVEITVKMVWNEAGKAARQKVLQTMDSRPEGYDDVVWTLVRYRFSLADHKMIILSTLDYNDKQRCVSLSLGADWRDIAPGTKEDAARQIALNWLKPE